MANPRYNTQVTNQRGGSARVGKMGGGMMMQRPMYKRGGGVDVKKAKEFRKNKKTPIRTFLKNTMEGKYMDKRRGTAEPLDLPRNKRIKKMGGGRIAGAARRAQEHGYYTPDMGMKGGRMYKSGGKVGKKKPRVMGIGIGKIKDYPGMKKIIEMNKKGKKRFRDGGSAMKPVDKSKNPGLAKLPTAVRNKMGYMKDGGKVKTPGGFKSTQQKGNIVKGKLKSQKELKKITSSEAYKKAGYNKKNEMLNRATHKDGGMARRRNTRRMNRLEELGRVDAERGFTRKGKRNLKAEKKRIVRELKK